LVRARRISPLDGGRQTRAQLLDTVGGLVAGWAARWGVEFKLPAREVVRGIYAISRGMGLEALLADEPDSSEQFEEMFLAYATGCSPTRGSGCGP
jgi:hypothetical protein